MKYKKNFTYNYWRYMFGRLLLFTVSQGIRKNKIAIALGVDKTMISKAIERFYEREEEDKDNAERIRQIRVDAAKKRGIST